MKNNLNGEKYIFVGGMPRSGTTMVQNILDSHPDICGIPEFLMMWQIIRLRNDFHRLINEKRIDSICTSQQIDDQIRDFILNILDPLIEKNNCKLLSEKSPGNVQVFEELLVLFPEARFIRVVRDPRATISSSFDIRKRAESKGEKSPIFSMGTRLAIKVTKEYLEEGFDIVNRCPGRVITVVYEKIVLNTEEETKRMCDFLKIDWSENMLYPGKFKHMGEKHIIISQQNIWYDKKMYDRNPEKKEIDKWKKRLSVVDQVRITNAFKDNKELKELGYDLSLDYLTPLQRFRGEIIAFLRIKIGDFKLWLGSKIKGEI